MELDFHLIFWGLKCQSDAGHRSEKSWFKSHLSHGLNVSPSANHSPSALVPSLTCVITHLSQVLSWRKGLQSLLLITSLDPVMICTWHSGSHGKVPGPAYVHNLLLSCKHPYHSPILSAATTIILTFVAVAFCLCQSNKDSYTVHKDCLHTGIPSYGCFCSLKARSYFSQETASHGFDLLQKQIDKIDL